MDSNIETCSICHEDLIEFNRLPCNHSFHTKCLFDWFISNATRSCPICRREFQENDEQPRNNYNIIRNTLQQWIQQFIN